MNEQRTSLRRQPQSITSLRPEFDQDSFNFTKIRKDEHLFDLEFKGGRHRISFIVNSSPLTKNHCLVVPDLAKQSPQVLSEVAIEYSLALLAKLDSRRFRMGFNSPGALASVNHLHLHVVDVTKELFSEHFVSWLVCTNGNPYYKRELFCSASRTLATVGTFWMTPFQVSPWSTWPIQMMLALARQPNQL